MTAADFHAMTPMERGRMYEETRALIRRLHEIPGCGVGGPLHIITDDPNYEDHNLDFCEACIDILPGSDPDAPMMGYWREGQTSEQTAEMVAVCHDIIDRLRPLSKAQRQRVCSSWWTLR